jgi:hypothetical protein
VLPAGDPLFLEIAEQAVLALTPAQREVVLMRVEGMTFAEIAQATSVGANTLKSRMNEATWRVELQVTKLPAQALLGTWVIKVSGAARPESKLKAGLQPRQRRRSRPRLGEPSS